MPVIDMKATGINIRAMRIRAGMSIADVQNICGVSGTAIGLFSILRHSSETLENDP